MSRLCAFFACLLLLSFAPTWGQTEESQESLYDAKTGIAAFTTGLELQASRNAQLGLLGTLFDGQSMNNVKGDFAEAIAGKHIPHLEAPKEMWQLIVPRNGRQGIDCLDVRLTKNGLIKSMIIVEVKYKDTSLKWTQTGKQMGKTWRADKLFSDEKVYRGAENASSWMRKKTMPIKVDKSLRIYMSDRQGVNVWLEGNQWYTDAPESVTDKALRTRIKTYGDYFRAVAEGRVDSRNRLYRVYPDASNGDIWIKTYKIVDLADGDVGEVSMGKPYRIPKKYLKRGEVPLEVLVNQLKRKYKDLPDEELVAMAKSLQKSVSAKELIEDVGRAGKIAFKESVWSMGRGTAFASGMTFLFMIGQEMFMHGLDWSSYDWVGVGKETLGSVAVFGAANGLGAVTTYALSSGVTRNALNAVARNATTNATTKGGALVARSLLKPAVAQRLGGAVANAVLIGISAWGCFTGEKTWRDGGIDVGINLASMAAGWGVGTGTSAVLGAYGITAGAAGGTWSMASVAAVAGPIAAGIAAGAAVVYVGYLIANHYKQKRIAAGSRAEIQHRVERLRQEPSLYRPSLDRMVPSPILPSL